MELKHPAVAGTLESSDIEVHVAPNPDGVVIELKSTVMAQFGQQIRTVINETLERLAVEHVTVIAEDYGALDCTVRSRVETAIFRAVDQMDNLPWGTKL